MNWSIERRFSKGIFLTPELLGYDVDEEGNLVVNPEEAETVKVIYDLYINGWSPTEIAGLLTEYGRKTKLGNEVWNPGSINGVIENERHCGDVRARKTYTPDFKTHKSEKNRQNRKQYIQRNHHEPIVDRDVYNAANLMKSSHIYASKNRPLPVLSVIDGGILSGYVPVDKNWNGFSLEEYQTACESVDTPADTGEDVGKRLYMGGYQVVRADYFPSNERPYMTITNGKLRFNTACLKKFEDVEYVELLLNTVKNCIAIRPCDKDSASPGISFNIDTGRITVFKTTLKAMNYPEYFHFRFSPEDLIFGIEPCALRDGGAHRLPDELTREHYDIKSIDLVRFVYKTCGWGKRLTYRVPGEKYAPDSSLVVFDLRRAYEIHEGRMLKIAY